MCLAVWSQLAQMQHDTAISSSHQVSVFCSAFFSGRLLPPAPLEPALLSLRALSCIIFTSSGSTNSRFCPVREDTAMCFVFHALACQQTQVSVWYGLSSHVAFAM